MFVALDALKKHLNLEEEFTDDDLYLEGLIEVVELACKNYCDGGLDDLEEIPVTVVHAATLLAAHLYVTRTPVSFAQGYEIPYTYKFLLNPYKAY